MKDDNRYDILQEVGRGAMGIVYKATDRETSECVALKVLKPEVVEDQSMMHRFKREMLIARKITHKNVCRIYDFTRVSRGPCITMEFVEGETLRALLNRSGALKLQSAIDITRQICSGLREAHAQGVAHRDLKPENLMIDRHGNVKIMDFGVARVFANNAATTLGMLVGTPAYMAPEQVEGRETDQRADIYSLGLIFYEMLTGSVVFKADTPLAVAYKQVHDPVPPPRSVDASIPGNVETLILRCLEKDPARRFQTIGQLEAAFNEMGYGPPTTVEPDPGISVLHNTTFIMARRKARVLMMAVQVLYFSIYSAALYHADAAALELEKGFQIPGTIGVFIITVLAMLGIATRVYLSSALVWDHPDLPRKFRRLFPVLLLLDSIWAASPILLLDWMRMGLILGCVAVLAYVPFSQKTLMENMPMENPIRKF